VNATTGLVLLDVAGCFVESDPFLRAAGDLVAGLLERPA
jgi:hypothetical protein